MPDSLAQPNALKTVPTLTATSAFLCPFDVVGAHVVETRETTVGLVDVCINCGCVVHYP